MAFIDPETLPIAWDRPESVESLKAKLIAADSTEWIRLASWIMREAKTQQVWQFISLAEIDSRYDQLHPRLGRRQKLWDYLIKSAREMGRI